MLSPSVHQHQLLKLKKAWLPLKLTKLKKSWLLLNLTKPKKAWLLLNRTKLKKRKGALLRMARAKRKEGKLLGPGGQTDPLRRRTSMLGKIGSRHKVGFTFLNIGRFDSSNMRVCKRV